MTEQIFNFGHTTLAEDLDASETTVTVTSGAVFAASGNFRVKVDDELMLVTARSTNDLTVTRGIEGTTAAAHSNGADIIAVLTAAALLAAIDENAPDSAGVLEDVGDMLYLSDGYFAGDKAKASLGATSNYAAAIDGVNAWFDWWNGYLYITLDRSYLCDKVGIRWEPGYAASTVQVSTSPNGTDWTVLETITITSNDQDYTLTDPADAKYWRFYAGGSYCSPHEFRIYSVTVSPPPTRLPIDEAGTTLLSDGEVPYWSHPRVPTKSGTPSDSDVVGGAAAAAGMAMLDTSTGRLHVRGSSAWGVAGGTVKVRDASNDESEVATEIIFPDGTVFPHGDGSVSVREVPTGVIGCAIYHSTTQSRGANTAFVFDSETSDTDGLHDTSSNTNLVTVQKAGLYLLAGGGFCDASPGSGPLYFRKNGTTAIIGSGTSLTAAAAYQHTLAVAYLNAGDYVEMMMGGSNTVNWGHASILDARVWMTAMLWGTGNVAGLPSARAALNGGTTTALSSTSYADVNNALDLVIPAQVGDVLLIALSALWVADASGYGYLDAATIVSGSPVNYCGGGSSSRYGVQGWASGDVGSSSDSPVGAAIQYVVQAGDISGGNVTLRLRGRYFSAARSLYTSADNPLAWSVVNLKGGAASRDTGYEFAYQEITSPVAITATSEGTANTVVTANGIAFDGSTTVMVEFFAPSAYADNAAGADMYFYLYDSGSSIGMIATMRSESTNRALHGINARRRLTPTAATHTYSIRAALSGAGDGLVEAGAGGSAAMVPAYIRVFKV